MNFDKVNSFKDEKVLENPATVIGHTEHCIVCEYEDGSFGFLESDLYTSFEIGTVLDTKDLTPLWQAAEPLETELELFFKEEA